MKRFRQILFWVTLVLIFALIVLCIVGAFLGADRAKAMFNSLPLCVFWIVFAALLAVGLFAWGKMWRSPGLLAIHIGLLLILAGGIWGSRAAHEWRGKILGPGRSCPPEGFLLLNPYDPENNVSSQLWRLPLAGSPEPIGTLPFKVQACQAWLEYYPPKQKTWRLLGSVYDENGKNKDLTPLFGEIGLPAIFPAVDGEVTVLGYNHSLRNIELQLTHREKVNRITLGPIDQPTVLLLTDLFDTPQAWQEAGRPAISLFPPEQAVKDYKAELAVHDGGTTTSAVIEVNHPLHAGGYHFYLSAFEPPTSLVIKVVSDDGLYWVYAGFALLMLGVVLRLWIEPIWRRRPKKEAGDVG